MLYTCDVVPFRHTRSLAWNVCRLVCKRHQLFFAVYFKEMAYEKGDIEFIDNFLYREYNIIINTRKTTAKHIQGGRYGRTGFNSI